MGLWWWLQESTHVLTCTEACTRTHTGVHAHAHARTCRCAHGGETREDCVLSPAAPWLWRCVPVT